MHAIGVTEAVSVLALQSFGATWGIKSFPLIVMDSEQKNRLNLNVQCSTTVF